MLNLVARGSRVGGASVRRVHIERKLQELGYTLPSVAEPKGNYRTCVRSGSYVFTGALAIGFLGDDDTD